ncbi:MAG: hypothetical protein GTO63_08375 [Anaerolineae bacterium]|nr:hypothetical protein [Anaerolineae bacterium]NIN94918.1 hypothetical protein [Anaerolineae bacterium]NIQ80059.1 hypothetical protein [Anaerolineae bacterium]
MHDTQPVIRQNGELHPSRDELAELMRAVIGKGRLFRFQAKGTSMSPFIKDGDVLSLSAIPAHGPRVGNVVAALLEPDGRLVVHRIAAGSANRLTIVGDNSPDQDGYADETAILAKVVRIERNGRRVALGLGPERRLIAFLSRRGWLYPLLNWVRRLRDRIVK